LSQPRGKRHNLVEGKSSAKPGAGTGAKGGRPMGGEASKGSWQRGQEGWPAQLRETGPKITGMAGTGDQHK